MAMSDVAGASAPAVGSNVGAAAVSGGLGLLGSLAQYYFQNKLMDKSYAQQMEAWQRQIEYMSPKAQMQRYADAGLNPDLIYGKMDSTNGSIPNVNTPSAPRFGSDVTQGMLAGSQIELQQSLADKNRAETANIEQSTKEMISSFDSRLRHWNLLNGLSESQTKETNALADVYKKQLSQIDAYTQFLKSSNFKVAQEGLIAEIEYQFAPEWQKENIKKLQSDFHLNESQARSIDKHTRFFMQSWNLEMSLLRNKNSNLIAGTSYLNSLSEFNRQQTAYLPFQMAEIMSKAHHIFQLDKDGNIVRDAQGMPKIDEKVRRIDQAIGYSSQVLDGLSDAFGMFSSFGVGLGGLRYGLKGFKGSAKGSPLPLSPTTGKSSLLDGLPPNPKDMSSSQYSKGWQIYNSLSEEVRNSAQGRKLYNYLKGY